MTQEKMKTRYYKDLLMHIILTLVTFGIYYFIWIYKTTEFTNMYTTEDKQRNPLVMALLCIFVPFFEIYWFYVTDDIIMSIDKKERSNDFKLILIITSIVLSWVNLIYVQDVINKCFVEETSFVDNITNAINNSSSSPAPKQNDEMAKIEEIKKYKELLDMGAITQEEFDAKKEILLDL